MAQARRRTPRRKILAGSQGLPGLGILFIGMIIGVLGTILWQGTQTPNDGVGAGISEMIKQSRENQQSKENRQPDAEQPAAQPPTEQQTSFDFFTVLPEIEVVVSDPVNVPQPQAETAEKPAAAAEAASDISDTSDVSDIPASAESPNVDVNVAEQDSSYILQAGSYRQQADADQLKARLALMGHISTIQKVTIQDKGVFYRVRLGPFDSYDEMLEADERLLANGIKSLRLKVSRGG